MSGPRIAQYVMGNSREFSKAYVVSNVNEQWISDAGVKEYFQTAYPEGYLTYPMHGASAKLPAAVSAVHSDIPVSYTHLDVYKRQEMQETGAMN